MNPRTGKPYARTVGYELADVRSRGRCEHPEHHPLCNGWARVHHHIAGRGGEDPHNPDNLLCLSLDCHALTHDQPARSRELGTMASRLGKVRP